MIPVDDWIPHPTSAKNACCSLQPNNSERIAPSEGTESYRRFHEDPPAVNRVAIEILSRMQTVVRTNNVSSSSPGFSWKIIIPHDDCE